MARRRQKVTTYKPDHRTYRTYRTEHVHIPGTYDEFLTHYHYVWYNFVNGSEIGNIRMAKFTIMPDGTIIYGEGLEEVGLEAQYVAEKHAKEKVHGKPKGKGKKKRPYQSKEELGIESMKAFQERIPDEQAATEFVEEAIWQGFPACPRCDSAEVYRPKSGKPMRWRCRPCREPRLLADH